MNESDRTPAERTTLAISSLILVALIGLTVWANVRIGNEPPVIEMTPHPESVREVNGIYYLPVTITNSGGQTAESVTVTVELTSTRGESERADVTLDFLAGGEEERAEFSFSSDPREGQLRMMPSSFVHP